LSDLVIPRGQGWYPVELFSFHATAPFTVDIPSPPHGSLYIVTDVDATGDGGSGDLWWRVFPAGVTIWTQTFPSGTGVSHHWTGFQAVSELQNWQFEGDSTDLSISAWGWRVSDSFG
jgi:hypothetical protein